MTIEMDPEETTLAIHGLAALATSRPGLDLALAAIAAKMEGTETYESMKLENAASKAADAEPGHDGDSAEPGTPPEAHGMGGIYPERG